MRPNRLIPHGQTTELDWLFAKKLQIVVKAMPRQEPPLLAPHRRPRRLSPAPQEATTKFSIVSRLYMRARAPSARLELDESLPAFAWLGAAVVDVSAQLRSSFYHWRCLRQTR